MTNEEAIDILTKEIACRKSHCPLNCPCHLDCENNTDIEELVEAVGVAIEALRKQNSKYYELGKKIMEDVQNALLYGTKGKGGVMANDPD